MADIHHLESWSSTLGLLPFSLYGGTAPKSPVILLNGDRGNFCLDLNGREPDTETRSISWSSNVGHYVSVQKDIALVQRWDLSAPHYVKLLEIERNTERFHQQLIDSSPPASASIIAYALQVFRQLRAVTGESVSGPDALGVFLVLLAAAVEDSSRLPTNLEQWNLSEDSLEIAASIPEEDWETLRRSLTEERPADRLRPNLELLLRHAAGALFQEAHYLALFPWGDQLTFGGIPHPQVAVVRETGPSGVHFTPAPLARALVEATLSDFDFEGRRRVVVLDPACGSGEFLRETARQLRARGFAGELILWGVDKSRGAVEMARFLLGWEYAGSVSTSVRILDGDSLQDPDVWPQQADLVLMNPPFIAWPDMCKEEQYRVRAILGGLAGARPDLASAFLWRAAGQLAPGGCLGTIVPASLLDSRTSHELRGAIEERSSIRLVARLGSHRIFPNALIDAGLLVASRDAETAIPTAVWADHRAESSFRALRALRRLHFSTSGTVPVEGDGFSIYPFKDRTAGDWAPRPFRQWQLLKALRDFPTVRDLFQVRQGVRTGNNEVFILPEAEFWQLPESEHLYFRPAIINDSIVGGVLRSRSFVFYPYGDAAISTEDELLRQVPEYFSEYLLPHRDELAARSRKSGDDWWTLAEYRPSWQLKTLPKIVSTYFGDVGSFGFDEEGTHVIVQGYGWIPRHRLSRKIWLAYLAIVNGPVFSDLLAASSNNVSSGAWDLSKRFVETIPIPQLTASEIEEDLIDGLAELGQQIAAQGLSAFEPDMRRQLREYSRAVYLG